MKRPVSYQLIHQLSEEVHHTSSSPMMEHEDSFDPFDPLHRLKPLRSVPRKISNVAAAELDQFDKWLHAEQTKNESEPGFTNQEKKARPDKLISAHDQDMLGTCIPTYRKIGFTPIPTEFKPKYEKEETFVASTAVEDLILLRKKYIHYDQYIPQHPLLWLADPVEHCETIPELQGEVQYDFKEGVLCFEGTDMHIIPKTEFYADLRVVIENMYNTSNKSFCYLRLKMMLMKFNIHLQCNVDREQFHQRVQSRKDFYNIIKVDNHIHLGTCMNQKHLQKFIKAKLREQPHAIVNAIGPEHVTLQTVMHNLGLNASTFTVDVVESYNHNKFEKYSNKFHPLHQVSFKDIFLSKENYMKGCYFAEIVNEVIHSINKEKYVLAEYRIDVDGSRYESWANTAIWLHSNKIRSPRVRWVVQISKFYTEFRRQGLINNLGEMLRNIFEPVIEATLHPDLYPEISDFLKKTVAFDISNNEEKSEKIKSYMNYKVISPDEWDCDEEPTYSYWSYYIYANLMAVNHLRRARGLNTFAYRPHCGEAGSNDHLATSYLLAHSINHGLKLSKIPVLQYLFYLNQIGMSLSPLSNSKLFVKFLKNPMPKFFARGLNVALSTDDPLSTHLTREPLMEEYSVAAQTLNLNAVDLCEIARNSVLQSGFSTKKKSEWLGERFLECANDPAKSNLSAIRFSYRLETFTEEHSYLKRHAYNEDEL